MAIDADLEVGEVSGDMDLKLRKVELDFSDAKIHWNPTAPEFSHLFNAFSLVAAHIEPYLIKVMRQIADELPESATKLRRDVDLFNSQEGRHYRMHIKFNNKMNEAGYDTKAAEARLKADFKRFLDVKGIKFSLGYSEGFETLGPVLSGYFFDRSPELMRRWDQPSIFLWLWHVAEEYEHRHVVNGCWKALYDDDYRGRVYGLWYCLLHLFKFVITESRRMVKHDLRNVGFAGRVKARYRYNRALAGLMAYAFPRLVFVACRPSYDPAKLPPIENAMFILEETSKRYGILEPT